MFSQKVMKWRYRYVDCWLSWDRDVRVQMSGSSIYTPFGDFKGWKWTLYYSVPFYLHGLTLIPAWISNYIHYNMRDEITYPFLNFNGATVEV